MFTCKSWTRKIVFVLLVVALCGGGVNASPPLYRVVDLGTLGGAKSEALAISDAGHVVGWAETGAVTAGGDPIQRAFLWHAGQMHDLGSLGGPDGESVAYGVNGLGQVVGWTDTPDGKRAFLWLPEPAYGLPAGMNDLGTMGHDVSEATDINERGEIVGITDRATFLWLPQAALGLQQGMNDLCLEFPGPGACPHSGTSLNDLGQVACHLYLWLPYEYYGREAGWSSHGASIGDISNSGIVVGALSYSFDVYYFIHNLWEQYGESLQFQFCGGFSLTCGIPVGLGVNEQGRTVGRWRDLSGTLSVGVFGEMEGGTRWWFLDQTRLVYAPGWVVTKASNLNNHDFVVGTGQRFDEPERAVLLVPVDPNVDGWGGVTLEDFFEYQQCLGAPDEPAGAHCLRADLEGDGDVDISDLVAFLRGFEER